MARYRVPSGKASLVLRVAAAGVMLSPSQRQGVSSQGFLGPQLFPGPQPGPVTLNPSCAQPCPCSSEELGPGSALGRSWGALCGPSPHPSIQCPQDSGPRADLGSFPFTALELLLCPELPPGLGPFQAGLASLIREALSPQCRRTQGPRGGAPAGGDAGAAAPWKTVAAPCRPELSLTTRTSSHALWFPPTELKTRVCAETCLGILRSFICSCRNSEATRIPLSRQMAEGTMVHADDGIVFSTEKKLSIKPREGREGT